VIARPIVHVEGVPASGKTALIEAVLRGLPEEVLCMRAIRNDSLRRPKEERPRSHPELRRYRLAGAGAATLYRFPSSHADTDSFYMTDCMEDYSTCVIIEGNCPLDSVDLTAFVATAPAPGSTLLHRALRSHEAEHARSLALMEEAVRTPQSLARFLFGQFGESFMTEVLANPESLERIRAETEADVAKLRQRPAPPPSEHWALASEYAGIERAQLVVVNVRGEDERRRGEQLVGEVVRLRKDEAVFRDIIGLTGSRIPITALVADLSDETDLGRKKAVARVKRTLRRKE